MRTSTLLVAAALLAGALHTLPVAAAGTEGATGVTAGKVTGSAEQTGAHAMAGTITKIDKESGRVSLEAGVGEPLELHFPPPALADLSEGDRITVHLALTTDEASAPD